MVAVLRREPELRGRLCSLLLADFACFGYDIQALRVPDPPQNAKAHLFIRAHRTLLINICHPTCGTPPPSPYGM